MSFNANIKYDDFVGFTFNDIHSSELNVIRTSESNRFNEDLVPSFQDKTVQVGGRDGTYLFGSYYQKKEFSISIAFDNVSEENFKRIQTWGADKKVHKLIFDERPYKYYNVKLSAPPQLKYICFDESENNREANNAGDYERRRRIYKGEGTLKFVCYEPFARGTIKSEAEVISQEVHHGKIYINKNDTNEPYELHIPDLDNVDKVALYLSRDWLYDRGEWGAANVNENGVLGPGQKDPRTGEASTSYYAYQPQKVGVSLADGNSTIVLNSNYQTYLFPIDLEKGFIGTVDDTTGVTNGRLIDNTDALYDGHSTGRIAEIIQYDPSLKVTYGVSGGFESSIKQYGCWSYNDDHELYQIRNIPEDYLNEQGEIKEEFKGKEVYKDIIERVDTDTNILYELVWNEELEDYEEKAVNTSTWVEIDFHKIFIVNQSTNSFINTPHSIYLLPNDDSQNYYLECRYDFDEDGVPHKVKYFDITVSDSSNLPDGNEDDIFYYEGLCNNYKEWAKVIDLPKTESDWNGNNIEIKNCGDIDMPFSLIYEDPYGLNGKSFAGDTISLEDKHLEIAPFNLIGNDTGIIVDMELRIIRGFYREKEEDKIVYTSNIYDRYITSGDYFYIPTGEEPFTLTKTSTSRPEVQYEYRYF